ncbi:hypothetical protein PIB30_089919 [Stylosanthes scabra]|uniref:Uncharacterized protein n=1 Tax=Stylosanthes scabra TaxID=79078 RepID=A0ABU6XVX8_9FABA|nr:hypothetical protein [Stylosanthes scabra]
MGVVVVTKVKQLCTNWHGEIESLAELTSPVMDAPRTENEAAMVPLALSKDGESRTVASWWSPALMDGIDRGGPMMVARVGDGCGDDVGDKRGRR